MKKTKLFAIVALSATLTLGSAAALAGCGHTHTYEEGWTKTETHHYHMATCDDKDDLKIEDMKDYGLHVYDNDEDATCNTCGYEREISATLGTLTGKVTGGAAVGATVSIGGKTATTDENGAYTVSGLQPGTGIEITITPADPAYNAYTGTVDVEAGSNTHEDVRFTVKTFKELDTPYTALRNRRASDKKDFKHEKDTAMWETKGIVARDHGEGLCLHIDNNETKEDMESIVYEKFAITSANSKMMFRVRGFNDNLSKSSLFAVRVLDLATCETADLTPKGGSGAWQEINSASYFTAYEYDLSAYEGKDVVIMIGAKQGQHCVIERIKFIGKSESFLLPYVTAAELTALEETAAADLDGAEATKNAINDASWLKVGDQGTADQGWLFKDGAAVEEGSTDLCVFTYKKLTFNGTKTISVRARAFSNEMNVPGKGRVEPQIVIKVFKADGSEVSIGGNGYTIATESYETGYFSLGETLNGDYTFVIGIARGHRLAVDQIKFLDEAMTQGTVTGKVTDGTNPIKDASVSLGAYETKTNDDGTFSLSVALYGSAGGTLSIEKEGYLYSGDEITVSVSNFTEGSYALANDIVLDKIIIGNITKKKLDNLTAEAAADIDIEHNENGTSAISNGSWIKVSSSAGGNHMSNEGWLIRCEDRYVEEGSDDINGYFYKKLTLNGVNTISVRARTFRGQNSVNGHGEVSPEIFLAVIDNEGNLVKVNDNCFTIAGDNYETGYFWFDDALTGDYTVVIGIARGRVLAVDQIQFKTEAMVTGNVTGTVTDGTNAIAGAKVTAGKYSTTTASDGTFTLPVAILPGNSLSVKVEKDGYTYEGSAITVASTDLEGGKDLGTIALAEEILKGLTQSMLNGLTAATPENITTAENNNSGSRDAYASWGKIGDQDSSNEGWLLKDAGNNKPENSTDLQVYVYKKFALNGLNGITMTARTYGGQNNGITPQIVMVVIDGDGNIVKSFCEDVTNNDNYDNGTHTFTFDEALTGNYTIAIGFARGYRLCLGNVTFVTEAE